MASRHLFTILLQLCIFIARYFINFDFLVWRQEGLIQTIDCYCVYYNRRRRPLWSDLSMTFFYFNGVLTVDQYTGSLFLSVSLDIIYCLLDWPLANRRPKDLILSGGFKENTRPLQIPRLTTDPLNKSLPLDGLRQIFYRITPEPLQSSRLDPYQTRLDISM